MAMIPCKMRPDLRSVREVSGAKGRNGPNSGRRPPHVWRGGRLLQYRWHRIRPHRFDLVVCVISSFFVWSSRLIRKLSCQVCKEGEFEVVHLTASSQHHVCLKYDVKYHNYYFFVKMCRCLSPTGSRARTPTARAHVYSGTALPGARVPTKSSMLSVATALSYYHDLTMSAFVFPGAS